jgi:hypothetical protein
MNKDLIISSGDFDNEIGLTRIERSDIIKWVTNENAKRDEWNNIRFDEIEQQQKETHSIAVAAQTKHERTTGYVTLKELGREFKTPIGSHYMGRLLRAIKVAEMSATDKTSPYQVRLKDGTARPNLNYLYNGEIQHYIWNPDKVKGILDRWLEKRGLLRIFYAATDERELEKIIRFLHHYRFELNSAGGEQELRAMVRSCLDEEEGGASRK